MNEQISSIMRGISNDTYATVARNILRNSEIEVTGDTVFTELSVVHNDQRTVGIVRVTGTAIVQGKRCNWSSVAKMIDMSQEVNDAGAWVDPLIEEKIYQLGLFGDGIAPVRPAKCYSTSSLEERYKVFFLEDLTDAPQPPWSLDQYLTAARHAGQFNAANSLSPPVLPFEVPVDVHVERRKVFPFPERMSLLMENRSSSAVVDAMGDVPIEAVEELYKLWCDVHRITPDLPHGVAFGDYHARNLFPVDEQTVAIDWAGLANEPLGADVSVLIGSAFSWRHEESELAVESTHELIEAYLSGLTEGGWLGDPDQVRIAAYSHIPFYLCLLPILANNVGLGNDTRRSFMEARFGAAFEEFPSYVRPRIAAIPNVINAIKALT